jgi:hypothetical protein
MEQIFVREAKKSSREYFRDLRHFTLEHTGGHRMHNPISLREQARKCRALSKTTVEPEVIEQLRVWAIELAEEADQTEWRDAEGEVQPLSNRH